MKASRRQWLALAAACSVGAWAADGAAPAATRQLRFTLSVSNPRGEALRNAAVWLYMPMRESATQRLTGLNVSASHELQTDALGHSIVRLPFAELPPFGTRIVTLSAQVEVVGEPRRSALADAAPWLGAERFIETGSAPLQALAQRLQRDTPQATATAIYDWVRGNLHYAGYLADDLGARRALEGLSGDCSEYAYLAAALARINGIPARSVGGYVVQASLAPRAEDFHDWAEVYLDGAWRVLDAQKEAWGERAQDYVALRIHRDPPINPIGSAHRFRSEGGVAVRL